MMKPRQITDFLGFTKPRPVEAPVVVAPVPAGPKTLQFAWESLARPHKQFMTQKMAKTLIVIGVAVCLILALMQEFGLIIAMASIFFIYYALTKVPPVSVKHEIYNQGINYAGQYYEWQDLTDFYFTNTDGNDTLVVSTKSTVPGKLFLTVNAGDKEKIKEILMQYLTFLEVAPSNFVDKTYKTVVDKFNI